MCSYLHRLVGIPRILLNSLKGSALRGTRLIERNAFVSYDKSNKFAVVFIGCKKMPKFSLVPCLISPLQILYVVDRVFERQLRCKEGNEVGSGLCFSRDTLFFNLEDLGDVCETLDYTLCIARSVQVRF